jgi:hypothetical protein
MSWLVLTYPLPAGPNSSPPVTLWRRLKRLGAVALNQAEWIVYDALYAYCRQMVAQGRPNGMFKE